MLLDLLYLFDCDTAFFSAAWIFTIVAGVTMAMWSIKKHKNYKKEFGKEYPRNRRAMIPFIL
jgi:very-long-chain enoyl-CoA reductase